MTLLRNTVVPKRGVERTRTMKLFYCVLPALLLAPATETRAQTPPRHDFPPVDGYQVLLADFHMHTLNSDGKPTTRERVMESYGLGYDVIAITDHGKTRGNRTAKLVGEPLGLVVLPGIETGINAMEHTTAIGFTSDYKPRNSHNWAENPGEDRAYYQDQMKQIDKTGGLLIYAHPHHGMREPVLWGIKQGYVHGIEVKNDVVGDGWNTTKFEGVSCYPNGFEWALEHNLAILACTDVHGKRQTESFTGTLVLVDERSPDGVMDAIRARRTAAWFNRMVWGREKLLSDLVTSCVVAVRAGDGSVTLENSCPITWKGTIGDKKIELGPYQKAAIDTGDAKSVTVLWNNVWTSTKTNLSTTLAVGR